MNKELEGLNSHEALKVYCTQLVNYVKDHLMAIGKLEELLGVSTGFFSKLGNRSSIELIKKHLRKIHKITKVSCNGKDERGNYVFIVVDPLKEHQLKKIASKLAINLIDVSTPFSNNDLPHGKILKDASILEDKNIRTTNQRERYILITGAGVSHAATKGVMPLGEEAINDIKDFVIKEGAIPEYVLNDELNRLKLTTRLDETEFETKLLAYSKFAPKIVKRALKEMCGYEYLPNLEYEILAHMFKHRFIDVVLNFNFDEIFDNVIKEEIAQGDFKYIISDGHCPDDYKDLLVGKRLKEPVFIKPHGTISHSNTMRFTRESLSTVPLRIKEIIDEIIAAKVSSALDNNQKNLKINFIVMGFGLKSPLLIESIKDYLKNSNSTPCFWVFDKKKNIEEFNLELNSTDLDRVRKTFYCFPVTENNSLSKYLTTLWDLIAENFDTDKFRVRGIERHLLINKIFAPISTDKEDVKEEVRKMHREKDLKHYFRDRVYVELFIDFLSSDGILNLNQIMDGRAGYYMDKLEDKLDPDDKKSSNDSISNYCKNMGLSTYKGFVSDVFTLKPIKTFYEEDFIEQLIENLLPNLTGNLQEKLNNDQVKLEVIRLAKKIKKGNRLNINPQFRHPNRNLFTSIKDENILNTGIKWLYKYREVFEKSDQWDLLLAVSEKGRFLPLHEEGMRNILKDKKVEIILASNDMPKEEDVFVKEKSRFNSLNLLSGRELYLPWWQHNRHMAIFLKNKKRKIRSKNELDNWDFLGSFYYEHRMLSKKINPIFIERTQKEDQKKLLNIFVNYWFRANAYTDVKDSDERNIPIVDNEEMLRLELDKLFKKYY